MADYGIRKYRLGSARLHRSLLDGFVVEGDALRTCDSPNGNHCVFLRGLDSAQQGCAWGRLSMTCRLSPEAMLTVRAFASDQDSIIRNNEVVRVDDFLTDPTIPEKEKQRLFTLAGGLEQRGMRDVLLTGQNGRWLWIYLELAGEDEHVLENMRVYIPEDHFFRTFPQTYQADNDFLRRYISIFSTMYHELQEKIDALPEILDVDTAPEELLPVFASWMGLETDEMLFSSEELRKLLKIAPRLMERKGSKWAVETAVRLFVPEDVYIVERNLLMPDQRRSAELYGESVFDFTVMVGRKMDEKLRLRLQFLIDQLKPIRSRYRIVFLEDRGGLDSFMYLDINGAVLQNAAGTLDDGKALTGMTYLE